MELTYIQYIHISFFYLDTVYKVCIFRHRLLSCLFIRRYADWSRELFGV